MLLNVGNLKTKWGGNGAILKLWTFCQSEFSVIIQTSGEFIYLILESVCFLLIFPQVNHFSFSVAAVFCHCIYTMYKYKEVFLCLGSGGDPVQKKQYGRSFISNQAQVSYLSKILRFHCLNGHPTNKKTCLQNPEIFSDLLRFSEI